MTTDPRNWICDRCGGQMNERNCKVTCPNCGNRFDCSDLNLNFDELQKNEAGGNHLDLTGKTTA